MAAKIGSGSAAATAAAGRTARLGRDRVEAKIDIFFSMGVPRGPDPSGFPLGRSLHAYPLSENHTVFVGPSLPSLNLLACAVGLRKHLPPDPAEGKEMKPPNSRERQFMQQLRGAGWVKATGLPDSPRILANLIKKGWVECQQTEAGQAYRLTELGLQAKKALIRS